MTRKALIRESDGFGENVIEVDPGSGYTPPDGCTLKDSSEASPGDTWDGHEYVRSGKTQRTPEAELRAGMLEIIKANKDTAWGSVMYAEALAKGEIEIDG